MKKNIMILFVLGIAILSCNDKKHNEQIVIEGQIIDSLNGNAVPGAKVTVLCWRRVGSDEETYDKVDTVSNENGEFLVKFNEGFKVDIGSIAPNYYPSVKSITNFKSSHKVLLALIKGDTLEELKELGKIAVFRRTYVTQHGKEDEYYGIDIINFKNVRELDSADISILQKSSETKYPKVLICAGKGGVIPIISSKNDGEFKIPADGYVKRYQLNGQEKGFFVRCRNGKTYARVMIFGLEYDHSSPYKGGYYKDYGIMFDVIGVSPEDKKNNTYNEFRLDHYILQTL